MEVAVKDVIRNIKRKYLDICTNHLKQCSWHLKNVAELKLVEQEGNIKELFSSERDQGGSEDTCNHQVSLSYAQLFKGKYNLAKQDIRHLVLGEAGVGKTILSRLIAEDWANGRLFQEYLLVLLVPLNQRGIASVNSLPELLNHLCLFQGDTSNLIRHLITCKSKILIIADEWDIFCESNCHSKSFLNRLLFGKIFPTISTTVIITARPGSFPPRMVQHIDRLIYIRGFSKDTVVNCVQSEFSSNIKRMRYLLKQLEDNVLIDSMCRVPINLAFISNLGQSLNEPLPNTVSELYKIICWKIVLISLIRCDKYKRFVNLSSYHDLPKELQRLWWLVCDLAFRKIKKGHAPFTRLEANKFLSTELEQVSYFGLLKSISMPKRGDVHFYFEFLHPAIEEYLAALHLGRQNEAVQLHFIESHTKRLFQNLPHFWRFYFGIHATENLHNSDVNKILKQAILMLSGLHSSNNTKHLLCHYSFEANDRFINHEVVKALGIADQSGAISVNFINPHNSQDCTAMIHVIENIDTQCGVVIDFQNCNLKAEEIIRLAHALHRASGNVRVDGLNLSDNNLDDSVVADFFHKSASALCSLKKLFLRNCGIGIETICAITTTLAEASSPSLIHLDLSYNSLSEISLRTLQHRIKSHEFLAKLEALFLKGSLTKDVDLAFLENFIDVLASRCLCLRRLNLSANNLGNPDSVELSNIISKLTNLRSDFDLCLNPEYMQEIDNIFISTMEQSIRRKGTIDHTMAHGIIVGPGRSGKNTLMNRLMGKRLDPDSVSPSTGVMETVVKIEVKKMCTVATAVNNLKWQRLEYDEEALELIMKTAKEHSVSPSVLEPIHKYVVQEQSTITDNVALESSTETMNDSSRRESKIARFASMLSKPFAKLIPKRSNWTVGTNSKNVVVYSQDLEPVDILKRAVKLRRMDALREHLESSWSLYLTNTGGQIEFQEHLPLLACGPSIFFVTFPLHHDLNQQYEVRYEESDGQVKAYQSNTTLLEELLQTLSTIDSLKNSADQSCSGEPSIIPKVFFVGTHKDKLPETTAEEIIEQKSKLLERFIRQTSLFHVGSIQFAQLQPSERLIFAVDNLSADDDSFQAIRSAVQLTVERNQYEGFTVKCPSSWLILSLILRARHKSSKVLSFEGCFKIAQECGISDRGELSQALNFIHSKLGLVRYFDVEGLNELVIVDPQVLFDRITNLLLNTITYNHAEVNQIEDFYQKGILPIAVVENINKKCGSDAQLPITWLTKLLNYRKIAALFRDQDGDKYFFPAALCHAPKPMLKQSSSFDSLPPLLIGFEDGFCPRGVPGALITTLMTNRMQSKSHWELLPKRIFRNQVSFGIEAYGDITLKCFPTHLELFLDSNDNIITKDKSITACRVAYTHIKKGMEIVTSHFNKCHYFWSFYCTLDECQSHPHPAKIEWDCGTPSNLKCIFHYVHKRGKLPRGYEVYSLSSKDDALDLKKEIDFCNGGVPKHLGRIADSMAEWEGRISDELGLTKADVASIKTKYPMNLKLQMYVKGSLPW